MNAAPAVFCKLFDPVGRFFVLGRSYLTSDSLPHRKKSRHLQPIEYRVAKPVKFYELWLIRKGAPQKALQQIPRVGDG